MIALHLIPVAALMGPALAADQSHEGHAKPLTMTGALGSYPMSRDASGTSWQPDMTPHVMGHAMRGGWQLMGHSMLNAVYDWQEGPRGDTQSFVSGMVMGSARRDASNGDSLTLRAMLSPDPFMGKRGYPLLLAAGETADGETPLIDRQHPHELFMELSGTYAWRFDGGRSAFLYAALPGEPAFGPPAFMHRMSTMASPEAPITHHWLDSTHISFGVVTAGFVHEDWKFEASQFTGREPDENRYDIERPRMDSMALRASWNPGERWSLQASWAEVESPEQLEPEIDESRVSASALFTEAVGNDGWWSATFAWGRKDPTEHEATNAVALEAVYAPNLEWLVFARAEWIESHELGADEEIHDVGKLSIGARREFPLGERIRLGLGALYTLNGIDDALESSYGGSPDGAMIFLQFTAST